MEGFTADLFWHFLAHMSKFVFWVAGQVLGIKSKHFRDFLEISQFPKISRLNVVWQLVRLSEIFLVFTSLKMRRNSKADQFLVEKSKSSSYILPYRNCSSV